MKFLAENGITYSYGHTINSYSKIKKFDFWINNLFLLEFDGPQHFKPLHGIEKFEKQICNDKKANEWCMASNIPLLRIPYTWPWEFQKKTILEWVFRYK